MNTSTKASFNPLAPEESPHRVSKQKTCSPYVRTSEPQRMAENVVVSENKNVLKTPNAAEKKSIDASDIPSNSDLNISLLNDMNNMSMISSINIE